jgi:signal peptidase
MISAQATFARSIRSASTALVTFCLTGACLAFLLLGLGPFTYQYRLLTVQSGSMTPTLPVGAVIAVTPLPLQDVAVGDIITFHMPMQEGVLVTHRVIQIVKPGAHPVVMTKGDANAIPDPWQLRLVKGPAWRVRLVVPHLGYGLLWWRSPLVRTGALFIVPLFLAAIWTKEIWAKQGAQVSAGRPITRPGRNA